ncbi:hypothetical protein [Ornithinimicrobium panacihumi]|uniref:hypothetical protein n=1 Tax=Ornithinimicrobium panacihumi TaxID=2008449 RepID=UPI003F8C31A0
MEGMTWLWLAIAAVVLIAIIAAVMLAQRSKKRDLAREEAGHIRERARGGETSVASAENQASELQGQARDARAEADRLQQEADRLEGEAHDAVQAARDERDRLTDDYVRADEIDPDVDTPRHRD